MTPPAGTPAQRLRTARIAAGFTSARKAALAMGAPIATYGQHERGVRQMTAQRLDDYLAFFGRQPPQEAPGRPEGVSRAS